jgi:hypothetical protein
MNADRHGWIMRMIRVHPWLEMKKPRPYDRGFVLEPGELYWFFSFSISLSKVSLNFS